ncbi:helix-turn-helix domain-containing protein [Nocardia otitidiscaviarum]|uniref:Helix-turn-helix domain-containing protein n=1 Tax=Nocardia otitidiscaviarum TaxID=1823 RepID=A0A516NTZ4_9NOCA|nr:helix-turn-helix domain-containing protein [Nocardia otitidiscaviarum]
MLLDVSGVGDDLRMDMRRLSPAQQEAVRKRVMGALTDGMSPGEARQVFGVSAGSIRNWRNRFAEGGADGLGSGRPGRRVGEKTKLSASQVEALVVFTPEQLELGGCCGPCARSLCSHVGCSGRPTPNRVWESAAPRGIHFPATRPAGDRSRPRRDGAVGGGDLPGAAHTRETGGGGHRVR